MDANDASAQAKGIELSPCNITLKDAIEKRRSIRKYLPKDVPDEIIMELIRAAQLAPSGSNAQPWRFKIVKDQATKEQLVKTTWHHPFIGQAPVILVCCGDASTFADDTNEGLDYLNQIQAVNSEAIQMTKQIVEYVKGQGDVKANPMVKFHVTLNVAIAIEHIVLRALDFNLGTCWLAGIHEEKVRGVFGWDDGLMVIALLTIGYPAESPAVRKRLPIEALLL